MNIEIKEQNGTYVGILSGWLDTNESSQFIVTNPSCSTAKTWSIYAASPFVVC